MSCPHGRPVILKYGMRDILKASNHGADINLYRPLENCGALGLVEHIAGLYWETLCAFNQCA